MLVSHIETSLALSLHSTINPEAADVRQERINQFTRPSRRLAASMLHKLAVSMPEAVSASLGLELNRDREPAQYLASSAVSTVFGPDEQMVLKVQENTIFFSRDARKEHDKMQQKEHKAMADHFGGLVLPQTSELGEHPFFIGREAISIHQEYRPDTYDPKLFGGIKGDRASMPNLLEVTELFPQTADELSEFVTKSREFYTATGLLPDTLGVANLVVERDTGSLRMLDGQPIGPDNPGVQKVILNQLGSLEAALTTL